jgi:hypothetical protein
MSAIGNGNPTQQFSLDDYLNQVITNTGVGPLPLVPAGNPHEHQFNPWTRSSSSSSSLSPFSSPPSSGSPSPSLSSSPSPVQQYPNPRAGNGRPNLHPHSGRLNNQSAAQYPPMPSNATAQFVRPIHSPTTYQQPPIIHRPVVRYPVRAPLPPAWTPLLPVGAPPQVPQATVVVPNPGQRLPRGYQPGTITRPYPDPANT